MIREAVDALLTLAIATIVILAVGASAVRLIWPPQAELIIEDPRKEA